MAELNQMLREHAINGLQSQLDAAVTNGDTEAARKVSDQLADLKASTAPAKPAYGDAEIRMELDKLPWFGVDPKKSKAALDFGKTLDPKKFATAALFAEALVKAVDAEFKPAQAAPVAGEENETDEEREAREAEEAEAAAAAGKTAAKPRKTDGPGEGDGNVRGAGGAARRGPWTKLSDAPADVQANIKRQSEKLVPKHAAKEVREKFISDSLGVAYATHQRNKGGK